MTARNKSDKFIELCNKRVNRALKDIRLIGNLSNKKNYEYTEDQVKIICKTLQHEIDDVRIRFKNSDLPEQSEFQL